MKATLSSQLGSHYLVNINSGTYMCCTASCSLQFSQLNYSINTVLCPGGCWNSSTGTLCGNVTYGDGPVCLAAQHAGKISSKFMLLASFSGLLPRLGKSFFNLIVDLLRIIVYG